MEVGCSMQPPDVPPGKEEKPDGNHIGEKIQKPRKHHEGNDPSLPAWKAGVLPLYE